MVPSPRRLWRRSHCPSAPPPMQVPDRVALRRPPPSTGRGRCCLVALTAQTYSRPPPRRQPRRCPMKLVPALRRRPSLLGASPALAADPESCAAIRLSDPGWTDITSTNAIASTLLAALGYAPDVKTLSVPIGYQAMKDGQIDVFLGNWMPAQQHFRDDLDAAQAAEVHRPEPRRRQVHPRRPDRPGERARRRRLQGPRRPRRRLRFEDLRHRDRRARPTRACRR